MTASRSQRDRPDRRPCPRWPRPFAAADSAEDVQALVAALSAAAAKAKDSSRRRAAPSPRRPGTLRELRRQGLAREADGVRSASCSRTRSSATRRMDGPERARRARCDRRCEGRLEAGLQGRCPNPKKVEECRPSYRSRSSVAAGRLAQKSRRQVVLLEIGAEGEGRQASPRRAPLALGGYRKDKKSRTMILERAGRPRQAHAPGPVDHRRTVSPVAAEALARLSAPSIIGALNELTGHKEPDFESYEELYKEATRRSSSNLFEDDA